MKRFWLLCILIFVLAGCGQNNREKAIEQLTQFQRNDASLIVFTDRTAERPFIVDLQEKLNEVNNENLRAEGPITNVTFYNVQEENKFNYEKIFGLKSYPYMILFEKGQITLETQEPEEIVQYFKQK
ncbi:hypothetical protein [Paenibacillus xylanexedens]|uniref:hypothetical protein n=1 Tax=Paenibacillus xylanexedens TaxID=528191 RepID=UPI000F548873|nr:hypothetical protein [Paenibacillus xylanexedens]KAA8747629.1 hypothetical protein FE296_21500 [Paenibacillus sp. UASWS1643]